MSEFLQEGEWLTFVLAALLIAVVYSAGVKTDASALQNLLVAWGNTFTGRSPQGGPFFNVPANPQ